MTRDEYLAWAKDHGVKFSFGWADDWQTLLSWYDAFREYDLELLRRATAAMLAAPSPARKDDHREALLRHIRAFRAVPYEAPGEGADRQDRGECALCGGSGWVAVPHPQSLVAGEWRPLATRAGSQYVEVAALCTCPLGRWRYGRFPADKKPLRLEAFAAAFPWWRAAQAKVRARQRRERGGGLRGPLAALVDKVRRSLGQREPGEDADP